MIKTFFESAGLVDRSSRGKLRFSGEQALWFLDQLLTNSLENMSLGEKAEALLLSPKGKITDHFRMFRHEDSVYADVEVGRAEDLKSFFDERVFMTRVEISNVSEEFALLELLGPETERVLSSAGMPDGVLARDLDRPVPGVALWIPVVQLRDARDALIASGATLLEEQHFEVLRIIEGLPRLSDYEGHLPQEAALEYLVHFSKGCYLGQEAVAMAQRGTVKRRLRHLYFQDDPSTGAIFFEDNKVGVVTSAAGDSGIAKGIGMVSTTTDLDSEVSVEKERSGRVNAVIKPLPGTIEGPKLPSARELRERLQGTA
jgi:folate-binding protein YgfZ